MTSHSRAVSGPLMGRKPDDPLGVSRNRSIRRRVIAREIAASPFRTASSARGSASISMSFDRKPTAPARSAISPSSSSGALVSMTTCWSEFICKDLAGREDAVERGHDDLHDDDVRPVMQPELNRLATVPGFGDHRHSGVPQRAFDQAPSERVGIRDDHAQRPLCWHPCCPSLGHSWLRRRPQTSIACILL